MKFLRLCWPKARSDAAGLGRMTHGDSGRNARADLWAIENFGPGPARQQYFFRIAITTKIGLPVLGCLWFSVGVVVLGCLWFSVGVVVLGCLWFWFGVILI